MNPKILSEKQRDLLKILDGCKELLPEEYSELITTSATEVMEEQFSHYSNAKYLAQKLEWASNIYGNSVAQEYLSEKEIAAIRSTKRS